MSEQTFWQRVANLTAVLGTEIKGQNVVSTIRIEHHVRSMQELLKEEAERARTLPVIYADEWKRIASLLREELDAKSPSSPTDQYRETADVKQKVDQWLQYAIESVVLNRSETA